MSSRLQEVSPNAEIISQEAARSVNVNAAIGLQNVLKSNLGPRGTLKMLVGGAGQIKLTKDGNILLHEMQIQHPTASMIARTATAQDDVTGDGTTSTVLLVGELLRQSYRYTCEGLHPRILVDGLELARDETLKFLDTFKQLRDNPSVDRDLLKCVALTSLQTKLDDELAHSISDAIVSAIQCINPTQDDDPTSTDSNNTHSSSSKPIDLNMIEIMDMKQNFGIDSRFVNGLVLDHGGRHPDMPKVLKNCYIMICNVTFEYEKTEIQSGFFYSNAEEREKLVESERKWLDERCKKVIDFKRSVCGDDENASFVIINQKGIDPLSLDIFAKEGILCLRRAKRRNMERLSLACGGTPIHSVEDLSKDMLGYAGIVSEITLGEDKFTFVEECKHPKSCTLLLKGPNDHTIDQIKMAVHDGLRALKNTIEDKAVVPGAGSFELAASLYLRNVIKSKVKGRTKIGIDVFAESLLIIPKTLAENSGFDVQDLLLKLEEERESSGNIPIGIDVYTGEPMVPEENGIWDNVRVKRQSIYLSTILATQLLLVDEVMKAGRQRGGHDPNQNVALPQN